MLRFVLALLCAGALWLGYEHLFVADARAAGGGGEAEAAVQAAPAPASEPPPPAPLAASPTVVEPRADRAPVPSDPVVDALVAAIEQGKVQEASRVFDVLTGLRGEERARLAGVLRARAARSTPAEAIALLGASNAFVKCDEGRQLARLALQGARREPSEVAVHTLTKLIEACSRGPIDKGETDARSVVDEAYGALKIPLRQTVLNPAHTEKARSHRVGPGDVLDRIARQFRDEGVLVDAGTIAVFNRIDDPRRLQAGQVLKIPLEPIKTVIAKDSFLMAMYVGDVMFRLYWIGHGKEQRTPDATFTVGAKLERPDWYTDGRVIPYGHPENVLGDYFVKFQHSSFVGFGAHGTSQPETIGTMASAGCIRMYDDDIAEYYRIVPHGSPVEIRASL